ASHRARRAAAELLRPKYPGSFDACAICNVCRGYRPPTPDRGSAEPSTRTRECPGSFRSLTPAQTLIATYFVSSYSPMPSKPPSRPKPDCLTPPKGAAGLETTPWLRPTIPVSSPSHMRNARDRSRVYTYATSPYSVRLAAWSASASEEKVAIGPNGPELP